MLVARTLSDGAGSYKALRMPSTDSHYHSPESNSPQG